MMYIGIWLTARRDEFYAYAKNHLVEFEEIIDPMDVLSLKRYDIILTDMPLLFESIAPTIAVTDEPFSILLKTAERVPCYFGEPSNVWYNAIDSVSEALRVSLSFPDYIDNMPVKIAKPEPMFVQHTTLAKEPDVVDEEMDITEIPLVEPEPKSVPETTSAITNIFTKEPKTPTAPITRPMTNMAVRNRGIQKMTVRGSSKSQRFGAPVITFSSLTDKAGVSMISFMLAKTLALQDENKKVLYLDLNISNPNSILNLLQLNPNTDAAIVKIAAIQELDFISNISLLTETVSVADCSISVITLGDASLGQKSQMVKANFTQFIMTLSNCFDVVLVDMGRYQLSFPYQDYIFQIPSAKHVMVADGSSTRVVNAFINEARELPYHFELVVNKYASNVGTFLFAKELKHEPLGIVSTHRNLEAIMTERLPFEGTALQNQLNSIGGEL